MSTENLVARGSSQPRENIKIEQFFRCLADNLRVRILLLLTHEGEKSTEEIAVELDSTDSIVRRQMALLSKNQLVTSRQKGLSLCYKLNMDIPVWKQKVLKHTYKGNKALLDEILLN